MSASSAVPANGIRTLLITLQRQKTLMERAGIQETYWSAYWKLSEAIWDLENATGLSAPAMRDDEDSRGMVGK